MVDPLNTTALKSQCPDADEEPDTFVVDCSDVADSREQFLTCISFLTGYNSRRYGLTAVMAAERSVKFNILYRECSHCNDTEDGVEKFTILNR